MKTITRTNYLERIIELNGTPDIKIITGIRRSGKSKLMQAYMEYLQQNFENINIIFIDFMDLAYEEMKEYQISVEKIRNREFLSLDVMEVPLERFKEEPFVLLKPENDTRKRAMDICKLYHFHPKMIFELDQQMTSYNLTCSGMGISFISDTLISSVPELPNVIYYKLPGEISSRNLYFYWKKGRYFKRTMEEFLKLVQDGRVENPER